jgi:glycosyltransferase involved in cell wall biosynthesis
MRLMVFTIVLDGMPWIKTHLERLRATDLDWKWTIVEGVARPTKDTAWVRGIAPRLSIDGTTQYLDSIQDKRVKVIRASRWENKTSMCNAAIADNRPGILLQMDADEVWTPAQFQGIHDFFVANPHYDFAKFYCNYYLGPDIVATSEDGYGNRATEWCRAWRFTMGRKFVKHEPPIMTNQGLGADRKETREYGLVFDHFSWVLPDQVKAKCLYYGGQYSYDAWKRLQSAEFPVSDLSQYLPWVGPGASADKIAPSRPVVGGGRRPDEGVIASYLRSPRGAV